MYQSIDSRHDHLCRCLGCRGLCQDDYEFLLEQQALQAHLAAFFAGVGEYALEVSKALVLIESIQRDMAMQYE